MSFFFFVKCYRGDGIVKCVCVCFVCLYTNIKTEQKKTKIIYKSNDECVCTCVRMKQMKQQQRKKKVIKQ